MNMDNYSELVSLLLKVSSFASDLGRRPGEV